MRLRSLDLIRYGKFTGQVLDFPKAAHDFHLIVGRNEAGKSTVRSAITELLFGMPRSSPLGFLHPQSELRLGACLEAGERRLALHRTKATKAPLRTPEDAPLPDDALAPWLGGADKAFFEQMFGLNHTRLVEGGQGILDARKDVGAALFQSAAGIASLGVVRDRLAQEANSLWGPRRAADRDYYKALQQLEDATRALKEAQVRTPAWSEAQATLESVQARIDEQQQRRLALEGQRARLERVRRLAPHLSALRATQDELAALGEGVDLPADAEARLAQGQQDMARAAEVLRLREEDVAARESAHAAITLDEAVLAQAQALRAMEEARIRCAGRAGELALRQREIELLLQQAREAAAQLGWPQDEAALRAALPPAPARRALAHLVKERGALFEASRSSAEALARRQRELQAARDDLLQLDVPHLPPGLREAVARAQAWRSGGRLRALGQAREAERRALEAALQALGHWPSHDESAVDLARLRAQPVPSAERVAALRSERQALSADLRHARQRHGEALARAEATALRLAHFTQSHQVITATEVRAARTQRDATWASLKSGAVPLATGAPALDAAIALADERVDAQLGASTEAAQLQGLRQQLELERQDEGRLAQALDTHEQALQRFDSEWQTQAQALGLPGLALDDLPAWLARREAVLDADTALAASEQALHAEQAEQQGVQQALADALAAAGTGQTGELPLLLELAEALLQRADTAGAQREALARQLAAGERELQALAGEAEAAQQACTRWESDWSAACAAARIESAAASVAQAEAAMELMAEMAERLGRVERLRREQVEPLQEELAQLCSQARRLAERLGAPAPAEGEELATVRELSVRLARASEAAQRAEAAEAALAAARRAQGEAAIGLQAARAAVQPLLDMAGVSDIAQALPLAAASARRRQLQSSLAAHKALLLAGGDGLALEALAGEVDAQDPSTLQGLLEQVGAQLEEVNAALAQLAAEKARAEQVLGAISGHALAATAEARRQEALAAMAMAAERYLHVATATRLLRWAIDRYRDRKQGPMLARASALFSLLTLEGFRKLLVDYEQQPPVLSAQRADGTVVAVDGLSEGTRDQLYLALRLAALELHLEQSGPLPFVADDLFINFDDARSRAGLQALRELSARTQVIFLTHHDHLLPSVREVFGDGVNVVAL